MERRDFLQAASLLAGAAGLSVLSTSNTQAGAGGSSSNGPAEYIFDFDKFAKDLNDIAPFATSRSKGSTSFALFAEDIVAAQSPKADDNNSEPLPLILTPIDSGADALLKGETSAILRYNPLECEYLISSISEIVKNLLDIRAKAQQLEMLSIMTRLDIYLEGKTIDSLALAAKSFEENGHNILSEMYSPSLQGNTILSSSSEDAKKYWMSKRENDDGLLSERKRVNEQKRALLTIPGGGMNYEGRFLALRRVFDSQLVDAYQRARAAQYGLQKIYGIDSKVPPISDTGYLDAFSNWVLEASRSLEVKLLGIRQTNIPISMLTSADGKSPPGLLQPAEYAAARKTSKFVFTLSNDTLNKIGFPLKNIRLKGIQAALWTDANPKPADYVSVHVKLPNQSILDQGVTVYSQPYNVELTLSTYPQGPIDVPLRRDVRNVDPIGEWVISIDTSSFSGKATDSDDILKNLIILANVSYQPE